jgi:tetratricopeptide (TPR) repeat protein
MLFGIFMSILHHLLIHFTGAAMNRFSLFVTILVVLMISLILTGFQCGSSEMTSAKLYMNQKNYERADTALTKEITKNPDNAEAWYLLGRVSLERPDRQDFQKMNECFNKALAATGGKEFEKDIAPAKTYAWQQSINKGVLHYNRSVSLQQDPANPAKDSITIYRQLAIDQYKLAIMINPDSTLAYQNLAIAQQMLGKYDDAIGTYKEILKRKPSTEVQVSIINIYISKAQAAEEKKDETAAKESYENALTGLTDARKAEPNNQELLQSMIAIYMKTGRANEAMPFIREMVEKDPTNKLHQYNLGVLLMQTDNLPEAITHFDAALQADPSYDIALQNIAVAHMKLGDKGKKAAAADDSKKNNPDKSYMDHFKKAAEYFERLVALKSDNPDYYDYLASAYANAGNNKKAAEAVKKAESLRKK